MPPANSANTAAIDPVTGEMLELAIVSDDLVDLTFQGSGLYALSDCDGACASLLDDSIYFIDYLTGLVTYNSSFDAASNRTGLGGFSGDVLAPVGIRPAGFGRPHAGIDVRFGLLFPDPVEVVVGI